MSGKALLELLRVIKKRPGGLPMEIAQALQKILQPVHKLVKPGAALGADVLREVEDTALRNLQLENLRKAVKRLNADEQQLIFLYFECELTMEEIGGRLGVSKMAISKRLKKLYAKLRDSVE